MKWFKHDTLAMEDPKIVKLMNRYGLEGYGLYNCILELLARQDKDLGYLPEDYDIEYMALKFKIDENKLLEMIEYMVEVKIFEKEDWDENEIIHCLALLQMADRYTVRKTTKSVQKNTKKLSQNRIEKNKIDKTNKKKDSEAKASPMFKPFVDHYWNEYKKRYGTEYSGFKSAGKKTGTFFNKILELCDENLDTFKVVLNEAFTNEYWFNKDNDPMVPEKIIKFFDALKAGKGNGTNGKRPSGQRILV
jgi:hypothetical protein